MSSRYRGIGITTSGTGSAEMGSAIGGRIPGGIGGGVTSTD